MATLGQELQRLRESKGISLHQIADGTHIGVRFLQAIENDSYDILPGGIFNRAFVRKFAAHVGMDEGQAISLYEKQLEEQGGEEETPRNTYLRAGEFEEKQSNHGLLYSIIALAVLGLLGWAAVSYFKRAATPPEDTIAVTSPTPVATPAETPNATPAGTVDPLASASPSASPSAGASPSPSTTPVPLTQPPGGGMLVQLAATTGECWISVKPDGLNTQQYLLQPGETKEITATEKLIFWSLGNYPALNMKINGRTVSPAKLAPTRTGVVVRNVVITKDNYQTFLE